MRAGLVGFVLLVATLVAGASTWVSAAKSTEKPAALSALPVTEVVKARVVYPGYVTEAMLAKISQTAEPAKAPPVENVDIAVSHDAPPERHGQSSGVELLDLNGASVEQLNGAGGGMIGKAIVRGRPYASINELLSKRVVNRTTFETIKQRVGVRS